MGPRLFLRARYTWAAVATLTVLAVAGRLVGHAELHLGRQGLFRIPWALFVPTLTGAVVATFSSTSMGGWERGSTRPCAMLHGLQLLGLFAFAAATTAAATSGLGGDYGAAAATRNMVAIAGLGLLNAAALGSRLAWVLPVAATGVTLGVGVVGLTPSGWALLLHTRYDTAAVLTAVAVAVAGLAAATAAAGTPLGSVDALGSPNAG